MVQLMRILVTGAAGRIGRHVVDGYLADGAEVRALVLPGDPSAGLLEAAGVKTTVGRLEDRSAVERAVDNAEIICHLAASLTSRGHADDDFFETNLRGVYNLLQSARVFAPGLRRLVVASSDAVYWAGRTVPPLFLPVDETHPREPGSVYGGTKLAGEDLSLAFMRTYGLPVSIMRPSATADPWELLDREGPFGRRHFVRGMLAHLERQAELDEVSEELLSALRPLDDGRERLYVVADADGRPSRTTLNDARDAADGMRRIAGSDAALGEAFNIGPATSYAEGELAGYLGERLGLPVTVVPLRATRPDWVVSSDKARALLGYAPGRTVFDMVDEAIETRAKEIER